MLRLVSIPCPPYRDPRTDLPFLTATGFATRHPARQIRQWQGRRQTPQTRRSLPVSPSLFAHEPVLSRPATALAIGGNPQNSLDASGAAEKLVDAPPHRKVPSAS